MLIKNNHTITVTYKINKPASMVYDYLADMQKFASVHPVITKIDKIKDNRYLVFETMRFGFIPYSFTYTASVDSNKEIKMVNIKARVMKLVTIEMAFIITAANGFSLINEEINFTTGLPIQSLMQKIFIKQHRQLFINIEKVV
ncbi:MAG: hypothetical protein ABJB11_11410 [Ferruginibacter sp.]